MFKQTVSVPRITTADLAKLAEVAPNIAKMVTVPIIETPEQAVHEAIAITTPKLDRHEYADRAESVVETETGWDITLICLGD